CKSGYCYDLFRFQSPIGRQCSSPKTIQNLLFGVSRPTFGQNEGTRKFDVLPFFFPPIPVHLDVGWGMDESS
ncbi:hypothetical protein MKX03_030613, partial [Papaver bracteatum]